jgi:geranylgeranyl diphosphate synthase type I
MIMDTTELLNSMRKKIEQTLKGVINRVPESELRFMLSYHMGWEGEGSGVKAQGKRIRPLLTLIGCAGTGGNWEEALPAAAGIELIHNFSLIHDDIEDHSEMRRGRRTVWSIWGMPQAINAGDLMFSLARNSVLDLQKYIPIERVLMAAELLDQTCLSLTYGQFLDMQYEKINEIDIEDYWKMIAGKTAALTSCCMKMGGIISGASSETISHLSHFGEFLGLAFQVVDDWLGIWGDESQTGKSIASDLVEGKKSLPVIFGLKNCEGFLEEWKSGIGNPQMAQNLAKSLELCGAMAFVEEKAEKQTLLALEALHLAVKDEKYLAILEDLTEGMLHRKK